MIFWNFFYVALFLSEELTYWGISELFVEPCCQEIYYGRKDQMKKASQREEDDMYVFPNTCMGRTKQWWWYLVRQEVLKRMILYSDISSSSTPASVSGPGLSL